MLSDILKDDENIFIALEKEVERLKDQNAVDSVAAAIMRVDELYRNFANNPTQGRLIRINGSFVCMLKAIKEFRDK